MIPDQREAIRKKDYWIVGPGRKKERKERKKQRKVRRRSRSPPLWELKNRWCPGCSGVRSMGQWTGHGASHALSLSLFTLLSTPCLDRRSVSRFTVQSCPDSVQAIRLVQAVGGDFIGACPIGVSPDLLYWHGNTLYEDGDYRQSSTLCYRSLFQASKVIGRFDDWARLDCAVVSPGRNTRS